MAGEKYDVLITDANWRTAVTSARSFGRAGLRVALGEATGQFKPGHMPPSFSSRYCARAVELPDYTKDPAAYLEALVAFVRDHSVRVLLPVGDASITMLAPQRERFAEHGCTLAVASDAALEIANDKVRTLELADKLGIPYPKSLPLAGVEDIRAAEAAFGYPYVVKPTVSWTGQAAERATPTEVINEEEAVKATDNCLATGCEVIAQQLASGDRISISVFMANGELLAYCGCTALRTTPPLGGVSVQRVSIAIDKDLLDATVSLVTAAGVEGASEVEYRCDAQGNPLLMEINPRLAGTLENAMHSGVNFPLMIWQWATGQPVQPVRSYPVGVRTRWLAGDLRWVWDSMMQSGRPDTMSPARSLWTFTSEFFRTRHYDLVDRGDMRPALVEAGETVSVVRDQWTKRKQWRESGGGAIHGFKQSEANQSEPNQSEEEKSEAEK
jgi:predicted ATP-grasp superfamily ATP-dependent carboligase